MSTHYAYIIASDSLRENSDPKQSPWQSAWSSHIGSKLEYAIEVEPKSHVCWIYDVPLYSVSGKLHVLKYADMGFRKSMKRSKKDLKL